MPPNPDSRADSRAPQARRLMQALASGERQALAGLITLYGPGVQRYAAQALSQPSEAEDIAQEVFLRAWRAAPRYDPLRGAVSTWLYRIAVRLCIDSNRRHGVRRFLGLEAAPDPEDTAPAILSLLESRQDLARLTAAIRTLPARQRQAILLRAVAEQTTAEIAATLGISPGAAEQLLVRGRAALRRHLDEPEETRNAGR